MVSLKLGYIFSGQPSFCLDLLIPKKNPEIMLRNELEYQYDTEEHKMTIKDNTVFAKNLIKYAMRRKRDKKLVSETGLNKQGRN